MPIALKNSNGVTNGATPITAVAAPAAGVQRVIPPGGLTVYNADTAVADVIIQYEEGASQRIVKKQASLAAGSTVANDGPIHLDDTDKSVEVVLGGAITTSELDWVANFIERS